MSKPQSTGITLDKTLKWLDKTGKSNLILLRGS